MAKQIQGDCECCDAVEVIVTEAYGMKMCDACVQKQKDATAKAVEANSMIQASRDIDTSIQIKPDMFQANTVAAIELMGAIQNDTAIPDGDKNYVMARESMRRFKHMQEVIFAEKKAFAELMQIKETEMRMWQVQVHTFAAKVEDSRREQFRNLDISYQPAKPKTVKSPASTKSTSSKKFSKVELLDAAKKYGVPMDLIRMTAISRNMTADQAAHTLADAMGQTQSQN